MHSKYRFSSVSHAFLCHCPMHGSWNVSNGDHSLCAPALVWRLLCSSAEHSPNGSKMVLEHTWQIFQLLLWTCFFPSFHSNCSQQVQPITIGYRLLACYFMCASQWSDCLQSHGRWPLSCFPMRFVALPIQFHIRWQTFWCSSPFKFIGNFAVIQPLSHLVFLLKIFVLTKLFAFLFSSSLSHFGISAGICLTFWVEHMPCNISLLRYQ